MTLKEVVELLAGEVDKEFTKSVISFLSANVDLLREVSSASLDEIHAALGKGDVRLAARAITATLTPDELIRVAESAGKEYQETKARNKRFAETGISAAKTMICFLVEIGLRAAAAKGEERR